MKRRPLPATAPLLVLCLAACGWPGTSLAHKVSAVSVVADFDTREGTFKVELAMDVDPTGDPEFDDQVSPEEAALTFATESMELYFDDQHLAPEPEIRVLTASDEDTPPELARQKVIGALSGAIPPGAGHFLLRVHETTEAAVVMVTIKDGKPARRLQVLYPGEFSNPVSLAPVMEGDPFPPAEGGAAQAEESGMAPGDADSAAGEEAAGDASEGADEESSPPGGFGGWAKQGFLAVIPRGLDFWAFLVAICLLGVRGRALAWQAAACMAGFSLSLVLGAGGFLAVPTVAVEAVTAISAGWLAAGALAALDVTPRRIALVFALALFHGLAFGGIFRAGAGETGPGGTLAGYGLGIALASLAVLGAAALALAPLERRSWYRRRLLAPLCLLLVAWSLWRFAAALWL